MPTPLVLAMELLLGTLAAAALTSGLGVFELSRDRQWGRRWRARHGRHMAALGVLFALAALGFPATAGASDWPGPGVTRALLLAQGAGWAVFIAWTWRTSPQVPWPRSPGALARFLIGTVLVGAGVVRALAAAGALPATGAASAVVVTPIAVALTRLLGVWAARFSLALRDTGHVTATEETVHPGPK